MDKELYQALKKLEDAYDRGLVGTTQPYIFGDSSHELTLRKGISAIKTILREVESQDVPASGELKHYPA